MEPKFYESVRIEVEHGGIEALHDHLLNVPLGDFKPWTLPPMTQAKEDLIDISLGGSERFVNEWAAKMLPLPLVPCRSEDLYDAFRHWCQRNGAKSPQLSTFVAEAVKRLRGTKERRRHYVDEGPATRQSTIIFPPNAEIEFTAMALRELSEHVNNFTESVRLWRKEDVIGGLK